MISLCIHQLSINFINLSALCPLIFVWSLQGRLLERYLFFELWSKSGRRMKKKKRTWLKPIEIRKSVIAQKKSVDSPHHLQQTALRLLEKLLVRLGSELRVFDGLKTRPSVWILESKLCVYYTLGRQLVLCQFGNLSRGKYKNFKIL